MPWDDEEEPRGMTRRQWVRLGMIAGTVGALGGLGGLVTGQLLPPPITASGTVREEIIYTKWPTPQWWNNKTGQPVNPTDFKLWDGATGVWRGIFQGANLLPGTGFPCLVIRIPRDSQYATVPTASDMASGGVAPLPSGFDLFYDDGVNTRVVVLFDRCVHLCCYPGWHVVTNPPPLRDYAVTSPTYQYYSTPGNPMDPIYCICHGSQYDPLLLTINNNPTNGANYVGAERVHGPAARALALIPVQLKGKSLFGGMADPRWYEYC